MKISVKLPVLLLAILMIHGCQNSAEDGQSEDVQDDVTEGPVVYNPNSATYIASVQEFVDAMLYGDSAALADLTSDDFLSVYMTSQLDTVSKDDFIQDWVSFQTTRTNQQNERLAASALKVNEGDYVGDWVQYWGNYSANMVEADTSILIPYFLNLKLTDGKISRLYSYYDRVPLWQAVGYQITPPGQ